MERGHLDVATVQRQIADDELDTVVVAFTDLQGRLVGKRVTGHFFADRVLAAGVEACNYLLAVDVDMTPMPGYEFANWEQGYGDLSCRPDLATLRTVPWLDKTALVLCDLYDGAGEPVAVSPRQVLRRQLERATARGLTVKCGSELEFYLFRDSYEEARAKGYRDLEYHVPYVQDYHVLQTTRDEYVIRAIRNGMDAAGVPVEFSKGEAGPGQHEINLEYADALEMADRHVIYKNGAKEIAGLHGRSITFMAKYDIDQCGSSCHIHSSLWDPTGQTPLVWDDTQPDRWAPTFRHWVGGLVRHTGELSWLFAPTVNSYKRYQHEFMGADRTRLGARQPHLRVPGRRAQPGEPARRVAGAWRRLQPLPRLRGHDRGRAPRARARGGPRTALRRQRVRRRHGGAGARDDRRRDHRARAQHAGGRRLRQGRARAPREHRPPGVGLLRRRGHRLGASSLLRAALR